MGEGSNARGRVKRPVVLLPSAEAPMAVLKLPVVLLRSASSPRTVFPSVKQPSWQTACTCGESAKQASRSGMRTSADCLSEK
jgi:hypothetical protein